METDEFKSPGERLSILEDILLESPACEGTRHMLMMLKACFREARRVGENTGVKKEMILRLVRRIWNVLRDRKVEGGCLALLYRICGECRDSKFLDEIQATTHTPALRNRNSDERVLCAYIEALGKLGRSHEAERLYFSGLSQGHVSGRDDERIVRALFESFTHANKISKAQALIAMYGARFLSTASCNHLISSCSTLRLHKLASDLVQKMSRHEDTNFPRPNARTYNLLLKCICNSTPTTGSGDLIAGIVRRMKADKIAPTTATYNTIIRSLVSQGMTKEAVRLLGRMQTPNRGTYNHLMHAAYKCGDDVLAGELLRHMDEKKQDANYAVVKWYLCTMACTHGVERVFEEGHKLAKRFANVIVFGDVGVSEAVRMGVISACASAGNVEGCFRAVKERFGNGERGEMGCLYVGTTLLQACMECEETYRGWEVFCSMKCAGVQLNFETYESIIYGLALHARRVGDSDVLDVCIRLMRDMYDDDSGRGCVQASYVYNTVISAAGSVGRVDIAGDMWRLMSSDTSRTALYISTDTQGCTQRPASRAPAKKGACDILAGLQLPPATTGTFNATLHALSRNERWEECLRVADYMTGDAGIQADRRTWSILADVCLCVDVDMDRLQMVLRGLDGLRDGLSDVETRKRIRLRQRLVALRWGT